MGGVFLLNGCSSILYEILKSESDHRRPKREYNQSVKNGVRFGSTKQNTKTFSRHTIKFNRHTINFNRHTLNCNRHTITFNRHTLESNKNTDNI